MKNIILSLLLVVSLLSLAACNTAHGAGKDIENAGETIQRNT